MNDSPRLAWVKANATELIAIAAGFGATQVCLCGSVARGTDSDASDIDFFVCEFREGARGTMEHTEARRRANDLVKAFAALCPYGVDVRGIPGWLLDPPFEATMRRDSIDLRHLVE